VINRAAKKPSTGYKGWFKNLDKQVNLITSAVCDSQRATGDLTFEEFAKVGGVGEVQLIGYFGNTKIGVLISDLASLASLFSYEGEGVLTGHLFNGLGKIICRNGKHIPHIPVLSACRYSGCSPAGRIFSAGPAVWWPDRRLFFFRPAKSFQMIQQTQ